MGVGAALATGPVVAATSVMQTDAAAKETVRADQLVIEDILVCGLERKADVTKIVAEAGGHSILSACAGTYCLCGRVAVVQTADRDLWRWIPADPLEAFRGRTHSTDSRAAAPSDR
jgi:hypothetical protein